MSKKWKVKALIPFPLNQVAPMDPETGGMPKQMKWESRVVEITKTIDDVEIRLKKIDTPSYWQASHYGMITEPAEIQLIVIEKDAQSALAEVDLLLEDICDNLSFRLQMPLPIYQLEVIDITDPVKLGDEREILLYPYPNGYKHPKFSATVHLNTTFTEAKPELNIDYSNIENKDRAVMRWYHKAIASTCETDKFIYLMICLEILCREYTEKVKQPLLTKCHHEITNCPECGKTTERIINGPTIKKFLINELCMDEETAKNTWRLRQMFHGSNDLSEKKNKEIPEICHALKCCVARGIKQKIQIPLNQPPIFIKKGVGISQQIILGGSREINKGDL